MIVFREPTFATGPNGIFAVREDMDTRDRNGTGSKNASSIVETHTDGPDFGQIVGTMTKSRKESNAGARGGAHYCTRTRRSRLTQRGPIRPDLKNIRWEIFQEFEGSALGSCGEFNRPGASCTKTTTAERGNVCGFEKIRRERGGGKRGGREKVGSVLNKFFDDKAESPMPKICNNQPINETNSESPEGEEGKKLDNMEEAFASTEKDERGPLEVSIGEVGSRGPKNGVNVVDNFPGFRADEKEMCNTVLRRRLTKGTGEVRWENRGIGVIPR